MHTVYVLINIVALCVIAPVLLSVLVLRALRKAGTASTKAEARPASAYAPSSSAFNVLPKEVVFTCPVIMPAVCIGTDPDKSITISEDGNIHLPLSGDIVLHTHDGREVSISQIAFKDKEA